MNLTFVQTRFSRSIPRLLRVIVVLHCLFWSCSNVLGEEVPTGLYGLTIWSNFDEALLNAKSNGFETIVSIPNKGCLDKAQKNGLKVIVAFWLQKEKTIDTKEWNLYLNKLRQTISELKSHPAVYAWYPVDEPDGRRIPVERIQELITAIKSVDTTKPTFTVFDDPQYWNAYLKYFDLIAVDPYLRRNFLGTYEKPDVVTKWLQSMKKSLAQQGLTKPVWVVLGAFDARPLDEKKPSRYKKPTPGEFTMMANLAIAENVSGILVYTYSSPPSEKLHGWKLPVDDPELWDAVRTLPLQLKTKATVKTTTRKN